MAEHILTFLRGAGFLLDLIGAWDLLADASGPWPAQRGFVIFKETKITAVIERTPSIRRGIEGTYAVEGNRLRITSLSVDTAPAQGTWDEGEFLLDGDRLTITWRAMPSGQATRQVDTFRRRAPGNDGAVLPPVAIYESEAPPTTA